MSLEVGQVLGGQYLIERVIGRGSMGVVYKGRDTRCGDAVAIRLILPEFDNEQVPAFFENDAKAVGQLKHQNIARLHNMGFLPSGERCLVCEYIEGETFLRRVRQSGYLSELAVAQLLIQLLESLSAAHEAGVVHRDLTPSSIFVVPREGAADAIKLIDFGISRLQLLTANPDSPPATIISEIQSFQYLSPEQLNNLREIDPRSNIYSLGVMAYEAITGRLPFEGKDFGDLTFNILQSEPPPVEELAPESSSPFSQLIRKAMARSPNARFQYAEEMYAAISNWAIRAGISKAKLESGVSEWRPDANVPVTSERPSRLSSPVAVPTPPAASETETRPWGSVVSEGAAFRAKEPSGADYFAHPSASSSMGLAEEDALFAPAPTAPRDELPFAARDISLSDETSPREVSSASVEDVPVVTAIPVAERSTEIESTSNEPQPPPVVEVAVEPQPIVASPALTRDLEPSEEDPEPSVARARTILGIGGVAVRPALKSDPAGFGVVVRGPDSVEPGVPPSAPSSAAPMSKPFRPRMETEPGIIPAPVPFAAEAVASVQAPVSTEPVSDVSASGKTKEDRATTAPLQVSATTKSDAVAPSGSAVAPSGSAVAPKRAVAAASTALDELEIPVEFSRGRSRKVLIAAILLIVLGAAGAALALLPNDSESKPVSASVPSANAATSSSMAAPPSVTPPEVVTKSEPAAVAKPMPSVSDASQPVRKGNLDPLRPPADSMPSVHSATVTPSKPPKQVKSTQVTQPTGPASPTKPPVSKGSSSKDPYNYR